MRRIRRSPQISQGRHFIVKPMNQPDAAGGRPDPEVCLRSHAAAHSWPLVALAVLIIPHLAGAQSSPIPSAASPAPTPQAT
jgi:hypothetical protein